MTDSNSNGNNTDIPSDLPIDHPPVGKIEHLSDTPEVPDIDELLGALKYPVRARSVAKLFERAPRPAPVGETNRKIVTYTITPETDDQWRDFLQTSTGTTPQRGKGISSAMVELAMQALMAIVAEFKPGEVAAALREISTSNVAREKMVANLNRLAAELS